jgi:hypothetical protein
VENDAYFEATGGVWLSQNTAKCTFGRLHSKRTPSARQYRLVPFGSYLLNDVRIVKSGVCSSSSPFEPNYF